MKKLYDVYQIDAFTDLPFNGNPAGVVYSEELSIEEMQLIAKEINVSETAFISKSREADFNLKWFTPSVEVKLCRAGLAPSTLRTGYPCYSRH